MTPTIEIQSPAKINLLLDVMAKRDDGFHEIKSLMIKVGLYDTIVFNSGEPGKIEMTCDDPSIPVDARNLIHRAAALLSRETGKLPGCRVSLKKRIPVAAGLGGGSGNAAGALRALNTLWRMGLTDDLLMRLGAELGSDVPFFFGENGAIVSGRGECTEPLRLKWTGWVALVHADVQVSTPKVYTHCTPRSPERQQEHLDALLIADRAVDMRAHLRNDLEDAVFEVAPEVRALRDRVVASCGSEPRVSGAGAVLFDLFDSEADAQAYVARLRAGGVRENIYVVRAPT